MPYGWGEHTGELELWVTAASEREVFEEALRAVGELLGSEEGETGASEAHLVAVEGGDHARLLAGWLEELAFLAETEGFVPLAVERLSADGRRLQATVRGRSGAPPHLVKAVTYHQLAFDGGPRGWRAYVVLDV
jgi:protein archease